MRKYNWKKIVVNTLWVLAGIGTIVLLGAAMQKKNQKLCADVKIEITGVERHMFIDEKDVLDMLNAGGPVTGNKITALNLRQMETVVERNPWVSNAEMFLDNNQVLQVRIEERQPVARVFTLEGNSFYVDSNAMRLPLSEKISARVPVFTGFPSAKEILAKPDSMLLYDIVKLGKYILVDSFWMAQVSQVDITPQAGFELVPVIGDHIVTMGNADELDRKFKHLYTFYQQAWMQNGINTYEKLDVQYNNQVVAIKKGTAKAMVDSARVHALMQGMMAQPLTGFADSSHANIIVPAKTDPVKLVKDSSKVIKVLSPPKTKSVVVSNNNTKKKALSNQKKTKSKKPVKKKPAATATKPKAVMNK